MIASHPGRGELSDQQVFEFLFLPGFSTVAVADTISGRGVGLDAVRKGIDALGGAIGVYTRPGESTRFVLKLPMTLALIEGQQVRVGDETYVIPLTTIIESRRPKANEVRRIDDAEIVLWNEEYLTLVRLYEVLDGTGWETDPLNALIVITEVDGHRCALMVDEIMDQLSVLIKGLGGLLPRVRGISGATILNNGKVVLVLNVSEIAAMGRESVERSRQAA